MFDKGAKELSRERTIFPTNSAGTVGSPCVKKEKELSLEQKADAIEAAVERVLDAGWRTGDIAGNGADLEAVKAAGKLVGTKKMGDLVIQMIG